MWSAHKAAVYARQHAGQYSQKDVQNLFQNPFAPAVLIYRTHYVKDMKSNLILAILLLPTLASAAQKLPLRYPLPFSLISGTSRKLLSGKSP